VHLEGGLVSKSSHGSVAQPAPTCRGSTCVDAASAHHHISCPLPAAAKYADLVLLLIDGGFGFEMETFEFLNLLQVHGFPKVMGVLTHLDGFRDTKALKKTKKALKHRFWTEIYQGGWMGGWVGWRWDGAGAGGPGAVVLPSFCGAATTATVNPQLRAPPPPPPKHTPPHNPLQRRFLPGAKLFYLSGLKNGKYLKREVHNLGERRGGGRGPAFGRMPAYLTREAVLVVPHASGVSGQRCKHALPTPTCSPLH
jgi:hypothetical protein